MTIDRAKLRAAIRNEADARDLVQDTCVHALEALARDTARPDNIRGWLVAVMRNHWFNVVGHNGVRKSARTELAMLDACNAGPYETRAVYRQLARAWGELPTQAQDIASQCLLDGDSQEEVSRPFGMTQGGVATSIHRTREKLRQSMFGG